MNEGWGISHDVMQYLRKLARQCGVWAAARYMYKNHYPLEVAINILARRKT